jgi:diguanylate cyclase (GGDEF)-like protein
LPWLALVAVVAAVQAWFTFVTPSFAMRLALSNGLGVCLFLAFANLLRQQGLTSFAKALTMAVLGSMFVILLTRLLSLTLWPPGANVFDHSPQQLVYLTAFSFFVVLLAVSLILLASERLHAEVAYLASHDSLTNALTRRHMNELCTIELDRSQRHGRSMALLIMDLDHFKVINDTYGHQSGDRVLMEFVAKVQRLLRRPDRLARFGGEEFVVLLPETSLSDALAVAQRIRAACAMAGPGQACTVSIGVTTNHTHGDTIDALIARADKAMYQAKANGRNRVEIG